MEKQVMALTRNLLLSGAFNHLSEANLSRLQWLLYNRRNPEQDAAERLMRFWYSGDYFAQGVPQDLLHNCNLVLQQSGKPVIDMFIAEEFEA
jgi:hypothetical protein